jgi:NAD(P)-dependent dehydrogenase (short-subunit alcohol dehydrogenase family)
LFIDADGRHSNDHAPAVGSPASLVPCNAGVPIHKHGEEGHVVNTASDRRLAEPPRHQSGPYTISKYAALLLSEALEHELAARMSASRCCAGTVVSRMR